MGGTTIAVYVSHYRGSTLAFYWRKIKGEICIPAEAQLTSAVRCVGGIRDKWNVFRLIGSALRRRKEQSYYAIIGQRMKWTDPLAVNQQHISTVGLSMAKMLNVRSQVLCYT